jgi:hypothetical protein
MERVMDMVKPTFVSEFMFKLFSGPSLHKKGPIN